MKLLNQLFCSAGVKSPNASYAGSEQFGDGATVGGIGGHAFGKDATANAGGLAVGNGVTVDTGIGVGNSISIVGLSIGIGGTTTAAGQAVIGGGVNVVTTMIVGKGVTSATAPTAVAITSTGGSGSNNAGSNLTIVPGAGTGSATPSKIVFQGHATTGTATNAQTAADVFAIDGRTPKFYFDVVPSTNNGAALGTATVSWADLFLASGGVINWVNGAVTLTHVSATDSIDVDGGDLRVSSPGTNSASVVTIGGTQTLTSKTLTSPAINSATISGGTINNATIGASTPSTGVFSNLTTQTNLNLTGSSAVVYMTGSGPSIQMQSSTGTCLFQMKPGNGPTNQKFHEIYSAGGSVVHRTLTDAYGSPHNWLTATQGTSSSNTVTSLNLDVAAITMSGTLSIGTANATAHAFQLIQSSSYTAGTSTTRYYHSDGPTNQKFVDVGLIANEFQMRYVNDAYSSVVPFLKAVRGSGNAVSQVTLPVPFVQIATSDGQSDTTGYMQVYCTAASVANSGYTAKSYYGTSQFMQWETYGVRIGHRIITNAGGGRVFFTAGNDSVAAEMGTSGIQSINPLYTQADAATITFDWKNGPRQKVTLGATGRTVAISNMPSGGELELWFYQDGTGSRTVTTWPASIRWSGGSAPTITSTASKATIIRIILDGSQYYGHLIANNF